MHIYMFWCFCKLVFRPYLSLPAAVTKTTIIIVLSLLPIQPVEPTTAPTEDPTVEPTTEPTEDPTVEPTTEPTEDPTVEPTTEPTEEPTVEPTSSDPEYEEIELTGLNGLNEFDEDSVLAHLGYIAVYDSVNTMWHL